LTGIRKVATNTTSLMVSGNVGFQCLDRHKEGCNWLNYCGCDNFWTVSMP